MINFENLINNVLAFPRVFRSALDVRANDINDEIKIAASYEIKNFVTNDDLKPDFIILSALNKDAAPAVC
jgi:malate dehydrogenase (oxaloacetate-decarboxylating)